MLKYLKKKTNLVSPELCHEVVEQGIVEVFTAEEGVAVGRLDLEYSLLDLKDTDVEGSTTKIKDSDTAEWKINWNPIWRGSQY